MVHVAERAGVAGGTGGTKGRVSRRGASAGWGYGTTDHGMSGGPVCCNEKEFRVDTMGVGWEFASSVPRTE